MKGKVEDFKIKLYVTSLGNPEAIIGLPWTAEVGCCFVLGKGKSFLTLGKQLIVTFPDEKKVSKTLICKIVISSGSFNDLSLPPIVKRHGRCS